MFIYRLTLDDTDPSQPSEIFVRAPNSAMALYMAGKKLGSPWNTALVNYEVVSNSGFTDQGIAGVLTPKKNH